MNEVSLKDFDILSEQDKAEAVALLHRYDQLDKQDSCQKDFIGFVNETLPNRMIRIYKILMQEELSPEENK